MVEDLIGRPAYEQVGRVVCRMGMGGDSEKNASILLGRGELARGRHSCQGDAFFLCVVDNPIIVAYSLSTVQLCTDKGFKDGNRDATTGA